jgi:membrane protease subunit (stomatin/prohibitin family)
MAGLGMGAATGFAMGGQMANAMGNMFQPQPQQPQPQQPPQASAPAGNMVERLKKLEALKAAGVLTEAEYAQKRAEILSEL